MDITRHPDFQEKLEALNPESFVPWGKTGREKGNNIVITEKMDGSNCGIRIVDGWIVGIQSRNRAIMPSHNGNQCDNFGFAAWVFQNYDELLCLGNGYHYGEWCGPGIQKNPHKLEEKEWFLFNTFRPADTLPMCVNQVPVLYEGVNDKDEIDAVYRELWFRATEIDERIPEGIIIYGHQSKARMKRTYAYKDGKWNPEDPGNKPAESTGHKDAVGEELFVGDRVQHFGGGRYSWNRGCYRVHSGTAKMIRLVPENRPNANPTAYNLSMIVKVFQQ